VPAAAAAAAVAPGDHPPGGRDGGGGGVSADDRSDSSSGDGGGGHGGGAARPRGTSGRFVSRISLVRGFSAANPRRCESCGTMATTQWRSGLKDLDSLCNGT